MANFTITITNSISAFGPAPSMRWGVDQWGTLWGAGTQDTVVSAEKMVTNAIASDSTISLMMNFYRTFSHAVSFSEDISIESIQDTQGYSLLFPGGVSNAHNRVASTYSVAAATTSTYISSAAGSTVWS